jgi:glycosyltransferase involved in cell wall biosynthesis
MSPVSSQDPKTPTTSSPSVTSVTAIISAKDEAQRIASTVRAARRIVGVDLVVVVDDGSTDDTARLATRAGAMVVCHRRNRGKAAAMATGARAAAELKHAEGARGASRGPDLLLFLDGDLTESAANLAVLIPPVASGHADMTIAVLPPQEVAGGGHGFVVRLARDGIRGLSGWTPTQPLSGMRCLSREAFEAATPLAPGWGVEVGLTIDVLWAGMQVLEVPCDLQHRVTGSDWGGQVHRARQYRDVWLALAARRVRAMPVVRRVRAMPVVGRVRAMPAVGRVRAMPLVGRVRAMPVVGRVRALRGRRPPGPPAATKDRD